MWPAVEGEEQGVCFKSLVDTPIENPERLVGEGHPGAAVQQDFHAIRPVTVHDSEERPSLGRPVDPRVAIQPVLHSIGSQSWAPQSAVSLLKSDHRFNGFSGSLDLDPGMINGTGSPFDPGHRRRFMPACVFVKEGVETRRYRGVSSYVHSST